MKIDKYVTLEELEIVYENEYAEVALHGMRTALEVALYYIQNQETINKEKVESILTEMIYETQLRINLEKAKA